MDEYHEMYLKDRLEMQHIAASTHYESEPHLGGMLVAMTMLATLGCILSFFVYGLGVGLRLLLAQTLLLFVVLSTISLHAPDETAQHD